MDSSIKRNLIYNFIYQLLILIIPLITTPYLTRVLGVDGIGDYTYNYSIATYFVLFAMLGLSNYGNRTIAGVRDDKELLSQTFFDIYGMQLITAGIAIVLYCIYAVLFRKNIMAYIMLIYVLSSALDISWFFWGMEQFKITVLRNAFIRVLSIILIFLLVKDSDDVYIYGLIMTSSTIVSQLLIWPFLKRFVYFRKPEWKGIKQHFKPNLILFVPVIAISLYKTMDKVMLGGMADVSEVGFYECTERIVLVPVSLVQALGTVMLPRMSNLVANKREEDGKRYIYLSLLLVSFLSASMSFGIMGISKDFVPWYYGPGFEKCYDLFLILSPCTIFMAYANVIRTQHLIPMKEDRIYIRSVFLGAIVNLVLNAILIPHYQSIGASIGTLLAEATVCIYQLIKVRREIDIATPIRRTIPFIVCGGILFYILDRFELGITSGTLVILLKIAIGAIVYISLCACCYGIRRFVFRRPTILKA